MTSYAIVQAPMLLRMAIASGRAVGIEITIYNPNLDPDGAAGRQLAEILVAALS